MLQLKRVKKRAGRQTAVAAPSQRFFRLTLILLVTGLIIFLPSLTFAASVTKNDSTDGAADASSITRTVEFTTSDFSNNASISSVTASVQFAKIDALDAGSCFSTGHQGGSPFNREVYMYLTSPEGTRVGFIEDAVNSGGSSLAAPHYTYTSNDVYNGTATIVFDDGAATQVGGPAPASGTFRPEQPLSAFMGEDPLGTWTLTVGDSVGTAPTCFYNFSLTVNAEQAPVVDDQTFSVPENSLNDTVVDTIVAADADAGDKLTYTVTGGTGTAVFDVDVLTGEITVADETQLTTTGSFTLNVTVTDSAALSDTAVITINVSSLNDAPIITQSNPVSVTMDEDGSPLAFSQTLDATDEEGDTLTWSIQTQASNGTASASGTGTSKAIGYTPTSNYYGSDSFVVQVSDGNGGTDTITVNVTINSQNDAPNAVDDTPSVSEDSSDNIINVLANDSFAPDTGETLEITAVGTTNNGGTVNNNTTNILYTPASNFSGAEVFTYTISDGSLTDTATVTVTVTAQNDPPVITQGVSTGVTMDEDGVSTAFALTLNASDLDNDTLTWSIQTQASNGTASASGTGTSKAIGYTPNLNYNGSDSFVVQVNDGNGGTDTITVNVTITAQNDDPDAKDDGYTVNENTTGNTLLVLQNDTTPDSGETLTIFDVGTPDNSGTANNSTTSISYSPFAGFIGTEVFTYTVSDGNGRFDTAIVTITVQDVNEAPVITQGASTSVTMDEDSSPVAFSLTLDATDPDGDTITWSIQSQGSIGMASASGTGASKAIGYTPNANMNGADSFVVRVSDGRGGTDDITVNVTIDAQNDNPDALDDSPSVDEQSSDNTIYPLANDTIWPDSGETLTITAVGPRSNGGAVNNFGTYLTYTPLNTFIGTDVFTYTISDGNGGTDTATIRISVDDVNFSPTITQGASTNVTMDEDGAPLAFSLTLSATDPDGNTLTWSIQSQATKGTAVATGTGTSKAVSYTPDLNANGSDSFVVLVSDGLGGLDSITVNVTIIPVNDDPIAVNDVKATPPETAVVINVLDNDSDPENDTLTITAVTQGSKGSVTHDGTAVTYTPNANEVGGDSFTYTVQDGNGGSATGTVTMQLGLYKTFMPVIINHFVNAPDLVVTDINASSTLIEVVIENQGTQDTSSGFWVDFYINPSPVPAHENEVWQDVAAQGIVWGVNVAVPAGESLTLRYSTAQGAPNLFYSAANSSYNGNLPVGTPVYAQADSAHLGTTYGGVLETHEILGEPYNNVSSQYTAVATIQASAIPAASQTAASPLSLPLR